MFHHGLTKKICSRGQKGFAIIFFPTFSKFYKQTGSKPPIIPENESSVDFRSSIGLKLQISVKKI